MAALVVCQGASRGTTRGTTIRWCPTVICPTLPSGAGMSAPPNGTSPTTLALGLGVLSTTPATQVAIGARLLGRGPHAFNRCWPATFRWSSQESNLRPQHWIPTSAQYAGARCRRLAHDHLPQPSLVSPRAPAGDGDITRSARGQWWSRTALPGWHRMTFFRRSEQSGPVMVAR
jgi:hypothetical protein